MHVDILHGWQLRPCFPPRPQESQHENGWSASDCQLMIQTTKIVYFSLTFLVLERERTCSALPPSFQFNHRLLSNVRWIRIQMNKVGEFKSGLLFFCLGGCTQFMEAGVREYWGKGWAPYDYNQMIPTLSCEAWNFNGSFSAFVFVTKFKCG